MFVCLLRVYVHERALLLLINVTARHNSRNRVYPCPQTTLLIVPMNANHKKRDNKKGKKEVQTSELAGIRSGSFMGHARVQRIH